MKQTIRWSIDQTINQSINQSNNRSNNRSIKSINQLKIKSKWMISYEPDKWWCFKSDFVEVKLWTNVGCRLHLFQLQQTAQLHQSTSMRHDHFTFIANNGKQQVSAQHLDCWVRTSSSAATRTGLRSGFHHQVRDATAANQVRRTRFLACRTGCMELTATWHSCCSQPCRVQETTQNTLF